MADALGLSVVQLFLLSNVLLYGTLQVNWPLNVRLVYDSLSIC